MEGMITEERKGLFHLFLTLKKKFSLMCSRTVIQSRKKCIKGENRCKIYKSN